MLVRKIHLLSEHLLVSSCFSLACMSANICLKWLVKAARSASRNTGPCSFSLSAWLWAFSRSIWGCRVDIRMISSWVFKQKKIKSRYSYPRNETTSAMKSPQFQCTLPNCFPSKYISYNTNQFNILNLSSQINTSTPNKIVNWYHCLKSPENHFHKTLCSKKIRQIVH